MSSIGTIKTTTIVENNTISQVKPLPLEKPESPLQKFFNIFDNLHLKTKTSEGNKVNLSFVDKPSEVLNKDKKVLIIGDSQTVGTYGTNLDNLVRGTKAKVITYASWGSSPSWWFSGVSATAGYWSKGIDGSETRTKQHETPSIEKILAKEKPDVVIVTMGGNMIKNATQQTVSKEVDKLGTAITNSGAKLFWAGPPKYDPKTRTPEQLETFYGFLGKAVANHGVLIDSRKFITEYHGKDGLHYSGKEGEKETEKWAKGVFNEIKSSKL